MNYKLEFGMEIIPKETFNFLRRLNKSIIQIKIFILVTGCRFSESVFKCDMLARTSKDLNSRPSALRQNLDKNPNLPK